MVASRPTNVGGSPRHETDVVVVGGGVLGCSIAYHLARAGVRDVLLVERDELAAATTSCAAGLVGQVRPTLVETRLVQRTMRALADLERELGEPAGFRPVGSLRVVASEARERDMTAAFALARAEGVGVEVIDPAAAQRLVPGLDARGARSIGWVPTDGYVDPYELATAYARAARARGVTVWTGTEVAGVSVRASRVAGVQTARGAVACRTLVDAAGVWTGPVADLAGAAVPTAGVRSHFWITAPDAAVDPRQPVVRFPDIRPTYTRPEVGGLVMGCYEHESLAYDPWALPPGFSMRDVPRDWDVFLGHVGALFPWFPFLERAEMVGAMAGLTTYAPDGTFVLGPVPGVEGLLLATGCSGLGVTGSGGIGSVIAELVTEGRSSLDLTPFRADRFGGIDVRTPEFRRRCALARSAGHAPPAG